MTRAAVHLAVICGSVPSQRALRPGENAAFQRGDGSFCPPWSIEADRFRREFVGVILALILIGRLYSAERIMVPQWIDGAPGFEARRDEPEKVINDQQTNIHSPTLTVLLPAPAMAS